MLIAQPHMRLHVFPKRAGALLNFAFFLTMLAVLPGCGGGPSSSSNPPPPPPQPVAVSVSAANSSVLLGNTDQIVATVTGTANVAVSWSVNTVVGGNATVGPISSSGLYTAPSDLPSPASVTITATSQADSSKSASATVTITSDISVGVATIPGSVGSLVAGASVPLAPTITSQGHPDPSVTWSVNGVANGNSAVGAISTTSAGDAVYTAPSTLPNGNPVSITAASVADPSKSASVTISVSNPVPGITLSSNSLSFGNQPVQTRSPAQTILVTNSGTGPLSLSSIAVSGANSGDFRAYNNCPGSSGALSAGASCSINVSFVPSAASGESATLTISNSAASSPQTVALTGAGIAQGVTVSPTATTVETGLSVPFIQNVVGLTNTAVTWSVNGVPGGDLTVGTISGGGLYTAPSTVPNPSTVTLTVSSQANTSLSASATINIIPSAVSVLVSPASTTLQAGTTETLAAVVVDTINPAVTWSVNGIAGGNSSVGTVVASAANGNVATYTAPSNSPASNPVTITATSVADATKSAGASVTISTGPAIAITSLDKTSLEPFNVLTITGIGFNPQAKITVGFSDSTGYSVSVPPVSINASSLVVGVPPYINLSTGDLASGSVNVQVSQTLGGNTVSSNTIPGLQIQNLPTLPTQPGAVTLALLTSFRQSGEFVLTFFSSTNPASTFNTAEQHGAITVFPSALGRLIAAIADVVQNPTHTFSLGVASGKTITVGSAELAKADRMIVAMLSAQASAAFVDGPEPDCQTVNSGNVLDLTFQNAINGGNPTQIQQTFYVCTSAQAFEQGITVAGASAGVATGLGGLLFGAEATAGASAAVSGYMTYATVVASGGLAAIGGALGQGTASGQALLQASVKIINDYLKDAVISTVVSKTFGETAGNLFDVAVNSNELIHAMESAPPYNGGANPGSTNMLNVSVTGTGAGTTVSFPGGIVCGGPDSTVCVAPFSTGETVYLDSEPAVGSNSAGFSGACAGSNCQLTMSSDQTIAASFAPAPVPANTITFSGSLSGSVSDEGHGGCNGGAGGTAPVTGSITLTLAPLSSGGYNYTGTAVFNQGIGICDNYSGTYSLSGQVSTLNGGSTSFFFGPAFGSGTFTNGTTFSGSWSFSVNVGPDVGSGTMSLTKQ